MLSHWGRPILTLWGPLLSPYLERWGTPFPFLKSLKILTHFHTKLHSRQSCPILPTIGWNGAPMYVGGGQEIVSIFKKMHPSTSYSLRQPKFLCTFLLLCGLIAWQEFLLEISCPPPPISRTHRVRNINTLNKGGVGHMPGVAKSSGWWYTATRMWLMFYFSDWSWSH